MSIDGEQLDALQESRNLVARRIRGELAGDRRDVLNVRYDLKMKHPDLAGAVDTDVAVQMAGINPSGEASREPLRTEILAGELYGLHASDFARVPELDGADSFVSERLERNEAGLDRSQHEFLLHRAIDRGADIAAFAKTRREE